MWLTLAILAYFSLALSSFLDKYILGGPLPSPKIYTFYTGFLSFSAMLIVPFGIFLSLGPLPYLQRIFPEGLGILFIPDISLILLSLGTGMIFLFALFVYFKGIYDFEISRIVPAVGGMAPIFTLILVYFFTFIPLELGFQKRILSPNEYLALAFLVMGSIILTLHRKKIATFESLKASMIASFLFSLDLILTKLVYTYLPFWTGFVWIRLGEFLGAIFFLFSFEVRTNIFRHEKGFGRKIIPLFVFTKGAGATGRVLQSGAIYLSPLVFLPIINALSGIQYVFLIILASIFFLKFPKILREEISKKVLVQKTLAVWLIVAGLFLLF